MIKRLIFLAVLVLAFSLGFAGSYVDETLTVYFGSTNTGGTGVVGVTDTIKTLVGLIGNRDFANLYPEIIRIILQPSTQTARGFGLSDSGYLWLYSVFADEYHLLGVDTQASLPCTLRIPYTGSEADSLFKSKLALIWRVADTVTDSVINGITFPIDVDYILGTK